MPETKQRAKKLGISTAGKKAYADCRSSGGSKENMRKYRIQ